MITPREDPVIFEVTATLREWHQVWISLYFDNQTDLFDRIGSLIVSLVDSRAELLSLINHSQPTELPNREQQINELKNEIVNKLDFGNRSLNLDLVPRDYNFKPIDPIELSPIKLYQLHSEAASGPQSIGAPANSTYGFQDSISGSTASTLSQAGSESLFSIHTLASYHLQMSLKNYHSICLPSDELIEIYFSIVDASNHNNPSTPIRLITDKFLVQIENDEISCGPPNTIFTNLGSISDLCLYIQVYRVGKMILLDSNKIAFSRQLVSQPNLLSGNQDGSTTSISSTNKYIPNGLTRSRNSTLGHLNSISRYRRPFGTTMVPLKDFIRSVNFKEVCMNIRITAGSESEFSTLHDLHSKRTHSLKNSQNLPNIQLDLAVKLISCIQESLPRMSSIKPYCLTEKRGYPDIVMPGDFKNDLYFVLESAEFEKGGKSISKNIEASMSLIDKTGLVIDKCISLGSNCDNVSCYKSCVFYHSNSPKWNESIKINVPLSEFDSAHIRIEFRHCSTKDRDKKFLGFSFLPLSDDDGTIIPDGSHELYLYKCDSQLWDDDSLNLCKYTSLPYGLSAKSQPNLKSQNHSSFSHSNRESVTVSTFLLSTKLTQNSKLLNLLKWRELVKRDKKEFEEALKKILFLKGDEIVIFLQDILDTLFETFSMFSANEDDCSALIFKVLIHIFSLLDEPRYQHFKPLLDTYASENFSATLVYKGLLACIKKCLEYLPIVERHGPIEKCFKSIKSVFQFIVQSKILYSKVTCDQNDESFSNDLRHLFRLFEDMLTSSNSKLVSIQVTFLESFPGALEQLIKVVNPLELSRLITSLAGSVGFNISRLPPVLSRAKLLFMKGTASSLLIKNQDVRMQISENFSRHLEFYIKYSQDLDLCYEVLELLVVKIHDSHWPVIHRLYQLTAKNRPNEPGSSPVITVGEISLLTKVTQIQANQLDLAVVNITKELEPFVNIMEPLLQLLDQLDYSNSRLIVQKYSTCFLTILKMMGRLSFEHFMKKQKMDYLKLCNLFRSFRAVYNRDWSVMQLTSHAILEHSIDEISGKIALVSDGNQANRQLVSYIKLLVDFITHPTLQLESCSERKKNHVLSVFGDLRMKFANQLIRFWTNLPRANICDLVPTSIQPLLDAALLPNNELQVMIIPVFWDMIDAEDQFRSNLRQTERCMIDNLDLFLSLDRGNLKFIDNFESTLKGLIRERSPSWTQRGSRLINSFTKLMTLLLNHRTSLENPENKCRQMNCLVDLLKFYKEQDRLDLHLKYLFRLCQMHMEVGNHVEAAFTLKLYADELKWCNRNLSSLVGYRPEEQEWKRKEALYALMIYHFDQGKCWEETIPLCKELASFYENFLVDYEKVSSTLKKLASCLDNILSEHRPEREYFRVEFLGGDQPDFVSGKEFIFRGDEYERLATFIHRMNLEFPEMQVLNYKSKQAITKDSPGQFMVVSNVKPVPYLQEHFKSGQRNISDKIIQYYLNNRLDTFSYDIPIMKGISNEKSGDMNVRNLWIGRYILKLKNQLPYVVPWSEVVSQEYIEISPINHAMETISGMNVELIKVIQSYKNERDKQISPLTMRLQGVIEAAVNGGPSVFVSAFLKRQPGETDTQIDVESLNRLRDLIKQQFSILDTGLALHEKLIPDKVRPLHLRLVERLKDIKDTLLDDTNPIIENNYEMLDIPDSNPPMNRLNCDNLSLSAQGESGSIDEVVSHDLNGNIYRDLDDQTYSQPTAPVLAKHIITGGSKSEVNSPSRYYNSNASSSLSTLALLTNLPINRSRQCITPSRETSVHKSNTSFDGNDLCVRAARKLLFDSNKNTEFSMNHDHLPQSISALTSDQKAPPLPPRSLLTDKHIISRVSDRGQNISNRKSSPCDTAQKFTMQAVEVCNSMPSRNLGSLTSTEVNRVLNTIEQESSKIKSINFSPILPCLVKPPIVSNNHADSSSDPPPLPQRDHLSGAHPIAAISVTEDDSINYNNAELKNLAVSLDEVEAKWNESTDDNLKQT